MKPARDPSPFPARRRPTTRPVAAAPKARASPAKGTAWRRQARAPGRPPLPFSEAILDALEAHICVLDEAGRILAVNRAWRDFAAANPPLAVKADIGADYLTVCEAASGEDAATAREALRGLRAMARGESGEFSMEYPCHSPNTQRWFELRATRVADDGPVRLVVAHTNITPRKQAEVKLQESQEKFRAIANYTADVECWFGPDGKLLWVNPAVEQMTGYSVAECFAMPGFPLPLFAEEDVARNSASFQAGVQGSRGNDWEFRLVGKDGTMRWGSVSWQPILAADGARLGHRSSVRDITDRKQAEETLRESEANLAAAQRIAHIGSWQWDLRNDTARWSDEVFRVFALTPMALDDHRKRFVDMVHPEDRERVDQALTDALSGVRNYDLDYRLRLPDGTEKVIHAQAEVSRSGDGKPVMMQGIVHDITERTRAQEELGRSREALRALTVRMERVREAERTRMARRIHDELGHAMTDLKLDLAWLARRLTDAGITARSAIRKRISAMSRRVESEAQAVRRIATELRPPVLDALGLAAAIEWQTREFQQRTQIQCTVEVSHVLPELDGPRVTALFRAFQEILSNVAGHAQATRVEVRLTEQAGRLVLQVRDNGRGITPAEQSNPNALGLLGMRERAAALGGEVAFEGVSNRGTLVTVAIPTQPP